MNRRFVWACAVLAVLCASSAFAVTYLVPKDGELIQHAGAIVVAHAATSHAELAPNGIAVTLADLTIDEVLKGDLHSGATINVVDPGGIVGDFATSVPVPPRYADGAKYAVMPGLNPSSAFAPHPTRPP